MVIHRNQIFYNSKLLCLWWEKSCFDLHFIFVHILHTDFAIWLITVFMTFGALSFFSSRIMCRILLYFDKKRRRNHDELFSPYQCLYDLWRLGLDFHFHIFLLQLRRLVGCVQPCFVHGVSANMLTIRYKQGHSTNFSLNHDRVKLFSSQPMG